jgi:autotransporter-associated beta strand protein
VTLGNFSGSYAGGSYSITGLLNLNGPGTANITDLTLVNNTSTGAGPTNLTLNGQVNINGGATLNATTIGQGPIAGATTLTTLINWTNGTIGNLTGGDLNVSGAGLVLGGSSTFNIDATSTGSGVSSVISGPGALTKSGAGTLTLTAANTYAGNTWISAGTLALGASGSIANSTNLIIAGGAMFDVSATSLALASGQVLSNSTSTAILNGNLDASLGAMSLTYVSGAPSLTITNGVLTLASTTVFQVNNTGAALAPGSYKLISKATAGNVGSVAGTVPSSVAVSGGVTASLQITAGELYLVVTSSVNTSRPTLASGASDGKLNLSWPSDHIGWRLLVQTNHLAAGLSVNTNDWGTVAGSAGTNRVSLPVDTTKPTEFYRLVYP